MFRKLITTKSLFLVLVCIGACTLSLAATPAAASSSPFDGSWNVKIVTQKGTCDSGSVPIHVTNGAIASDVSLVKASGRITANGGLTVKVSHGVENASGVGKLSNSSGSGTWKGGQCSGTWTASKN
jgi:hypothetical protein